jgi:hypothetical protein
MNIKEAIQALAQRSTEMYCKICTVDAVDAEARTVDCSPIDESAPLLGVNLQANQEGEDGVVVFPAVGSYVVVAFLNEAAAVVVLTDEVDKVVLKMGKTAAEIVDGEMSIAIEDGATAKLTGSEIAFAVKDSRVNVNANGTMEAGVGETMIEVTKDGIKLNGGENGGLVHIEKFTTKVNELINAFNNHIHEIPSGGIAVTGSATAQTNSYLVLVPPISSKHTEVIASDYENNKVKH